MGSIISGLCYLTWLHPSTQMMVDKVVDHEPLAILTLLSTCMKNSIEDERAQHKKQLAAEKQKAKTIEEKYVSSRSTMTMDNDLLLFYCLNLFL